MKLGTISGPIKMISAKRRAATTPASPAEKRAYALADNKLALNACAGWRFDPPTNDLACMIIDRDSRGFRLGTIGFERVGAPVRARRKHRRKGNATVVVRALHQRYELFGSREPPVAIAIGHL